MAQDTVDAVLKLRGRFRRCRTRRLRLRGAGGGGTGDPHLDGRYGDEAAQVRALVEEDSTLGEPLVPGLAYLRAEAVHAVRHEMATTLDDVLSRRTRARLEDRAATLAAAPAVADLMAAEAGWSDERRDGEVATLRASIEAEVAAAG